MVKFKPITLSTIVDCIQGSALNRAEDIAVEHLAEPLEADQNGICFIISEGFLSDLAKTKASVVVAQTKFTEQVKKFLPSLVQAVIFCEDAYLGLARFTQYIRNQNPGWDWDLKEQQSQPQVHASAVIAPSAVVSDGAQIGARTLLLAGVVVGPYVTIGEDCVLFPNVVLYPRTVIGNRVRIHANAVIGSDGFGYARSKAEAVKIWHLGRVIIGDDVEIGSATMIDRGTMKDTIIEQGAKLDNLVQVGHNGHIKSGAILCAQTGLAGNVTVGRGAILAGKAAVADKVKIGDGAVVGALSGIAKDVAAGEVMMGAHLARPRRQWWKLLAYFDKLPDLNDRVKKLEGHLKNAVDSD